MLPFVWAQSVEFSFFAWFSFVTASHKTGMAGYGKQNRWKKVPFFGDMDRIPTLELKGVLSLWVDLFLGLLKSGVRSVRSVRSVYDPSSMS